MLHGKLPCYILLGAVSFYIFHCVAPGARAQTLAQYLGPLELPLLSDRNYSIYRILVAKEKITVQPVSFLHTSFILQEHVSMSRPSGMAQRNLSLTVKGTRGPTRKKRGQGRHPEKRTLASRDEAAGTVHVCNAVAW
jgi:hypothetical protein